MTVLVGRQAPDFLDGHEHLAGQGRTEIQRVVANPIELAGKRLPAAKHDAVSVRRQSGDTDHQSHQPKPKSKHYNNLLRSSYIDLSLV